MTPESPGIASESYFKTLNCRQRLLQLGPWRNLFSLPPENPPDFVHTGHQTSFAREERFVRAYERAIAAVGRDYRIPWRVHQAIWAAQTAERIVGDFVELGTGRGFVMSAVLESFPRWNEGARALYCFDVFEAQSVSGVGDPKHSAFYADGIEDVQANFSAWKNVHLVAGDVRNTTRDVRTHGITDISFLHVDLNDAQLEVEIVSRLWHIVSPGGVVLLDDYANNGHQEHYSLFSELFETFGRPILSTPAGQGLVIR